MGINNARPRGFFFFHLNRGAGEMAQRLRALPALPEVASSIPSDRVILGLQAGNGKTDFSYFWSNNLICARFKMV